MHLIAVITGSLLALGMIGIASVFYDVHIAHKWGAFETRMGCKGSIGENEIYETLKYVVWGVIPVLMIWTVLMIIWGVNQIPYLAFGICLIVIWKLCYQAKKKKGMNHTYASRLMIWAMLLILGGVHILNFGFDGRREIIICTWGADFIFVSVAMIMGVSVLIEWRNGNPPVEDFYEN